MERLPAQYHSTPCKVMQPGQLYSAERCVEQCTQRAIRQQCGCAVTFSCDGDDCNTFPFKGKGLPSCYSAAKRAESVPKSCDGLTHMVPNCDPASRKQPRSKEANSR